MTIEKYIQNVKQGKEIKEPAVDKAAEEIFHITGGHSVRLDQNTIDSLEALLSRRGQPALSDIMENAKGLYRSDFIRESLENISQATDAERKILITNFVNAIEEERFERSN